MSLPLLRVLATKAALRRARTGLGMALGALIGAAATIGHAEADIAGFGAASPGASSPGASMRSGAVVWPAQSFMTEADVYRTFSAQGFIQIEVQSLSSREATVVACREGRRQRLSMDRFFRIGYLGDLGACGPVAGQQGGFGGQQGGFGGQQGGFGGQQGGFGGQQGGFGGQQGGFGGQQGGFGGQQGGEQLLGEGFGPAGRSIERRVRLDDLHSALRRESYYDPRFQGAFEATACQRDLLYRLTIQVFSRVDVFQGPVIGDCRTYTGAFQRERMLEPTPTVPNLEPGLEDLMRAIELQRFSTPELLTPVSFSACLRESRYDMRADFAADGRLQILRGVLLGRCASGVQPPVTGEPPILTPDPFNPNPPSVVLGDRRLRELLREQGYRRIFFNARTASSVDVDGCFGVRLFEMRLDRIDGRITARRAAGFCRLDQADVEYVPPRPVPRELLTAQTPLNPPTCQQVLNWFQRNSPITFPSGSASMDPDSAESIRRMALGFSRCGDVRVLVEGHTDDVGLAVDNQILSERRASEVANAFITYGVPPERIRATGYGLEHPLAPNTTSSNRALNRRIELTLEWGAF